MASRESIYKVVDILKKLNSRFLKKHAKRIADSLATEKFHNLSNAAEPLLQKVIGNQELTPEETTIVENYSRYRDYFDLYNLIFDLKRSKAKDYARQYEKLFKRMNKERVDAGLSAITDRQVESFIDNRIPKDFDKWNKSENYIKDISDSKNITPAYETEEKDVGDYIFKKLTEGKFPILSRELQQKLFKNRSLDLEDKSLEDKVILEIQNLLNSVGITIDGVNNVEIEDVTLESVLSKIFQDLLSYHNIDNVSDLASMLAILKNVPKYMEARGLTEDASHQDLPWESTDTYGDTIDIGDKVMLLAGWLDDKIVISGKEANIRDLKIRLALALTELTEHIADSRYKYSEEDMAILNDADSQITKDYEADLSEVENPEELVPAYDLVVFGLNQEETDKKLGRPVAMAAVTVYITKNGAWTIDNEAGDISLCDMIKAFAADSHVDKNSNQGLNKFYADLETKLQEYFSRDLKEAKRISIGKYNVGTGLTLAKGGKSQPVEEETDIDAKNKKNKALIDFFGASGGSFSEGVMGVVKGFKFMQDVASSPVFSGKDPNTALPYIKWVIVDTQKSEFGTVMVPYYDIVKIRTEYKESSEYVFLKKIGGIVLRRERLRNLYGIINPAPLMGDFGLSNWAPSVKEESAKQDKEEIEEESAS